MNLKTWAAVLLIGLAIAGCAPKAPEPTGPVYPPPVAPTPDTRQRIQRLAPDALIGQVLAVLPDQRLALVGDVPVQDFKVGQVLTFMGGDEVTIGNGLIVAIGADTLHVRYEEPAPGGRPPAVGDLAIRFRR